MQDIERFIAGFRAFQKNYFGPEGSQFDILKHGQNPSTMIIGCSDSRVDPAILTNCQPGDIFTVRNVANLVPPYEENGVYHGVSAALEFAVCRLEVERIIVLGHSQCGGIGALMTGDCGAEGAGFIGRWMSIAAPAREQVMAALRAKTLLYSTAPRNRRLCCSRWKTCGPSPSSTSASLPARCRSMGGIST